MQTINSSLSPRGYKRKDVDILGQQTLDTFSSLREKLSAHPSVTSDVLNLKNVTSVRGQK